MMVQDVTIHQAQRRLRAALSDGDTLTALDLLRLWLEYPRAPEPIEEAPIAVAMAEDFAAAAGALSTGLGAGWDVGGALFEVGRAFLRLDLPAIAATILIRAHELQPTDRDIASSAVAALLAGGHPDDARKVAERAALAHSSDIVELYLAAFTAVATADLDAVPALLDAMRRPAGEAEQGLVRRIEAMYGRARHLKGAGRLDEADLRGWHYVLTGGLLLTYSPHGAHMHGRYGFARDTVGRCRNAIARVQSTLGALRLEVPRVVALDDVDSVILGSAVGLVLELPVVRWSEAGQRRHGLVVAYSIGNQPSSVVQVLRKHEPDQVLWNHVADWTRDEAVAGDLTSLLAQASRPEWHEDGGAASFDLGGWANRIAHADVGEYRQQFDVEDLSNLVEVTTSQAVDEELAPAAMLQHGWRLKQWAASPVRSARF